MNSVWPKNNVVPPFPLPSRYISTIQLQEGNHNSQVDTSKPKLNLNDFSILINGCKQQIKSMEVTETKQKENAERYFDIEYEFFRKELQA